MWIIFLGVSLILLFFLLRTTKSTPVVSSISIYPIKSCRAVNLTKVSISSTGMLYDREWAIISESNQVITQKEDTRLLNLIPSLNFKGPEISSIELRYESHSFNLIPQKTGEIINLNCKDAPCDGLTEGEEVHQFLSKIFDKDYRLVRLIKPRQLNNKPRYQGLISDEHKTGFVNTAQFLVVAQESFDRTKESLPEEKRDAFDIESLRANIVVSGCYPFQEDRWARFGIGNVEFQGIGKCARCFITTVNQKNLEADKEAEPLATLRKLNGNGTKGFLGMHCVKLSEGEISVGQPVIIKEAKEFLYI